MSQENDTGLKSFDVDGAIAKYARVHLASGKLSLSGASDFSIGTLTQQSFASGEGRTVRLRNHPGTRKMIAAGAIASAGLKVFGAANGKVSTVAAGQFEGIALHPVSGDGSIVEVYYDPAMDAGDVGTVAAAGSSQADAAAIVNITTIATDADGTKGHRLPPASPILGPRYVYNTHASNGLKIYPASGDDINDGTTDAAITIEGKTLAIFVPLDTTTWAAIFTPNS